MGHFILFHIFDWVSIHNSHVLTSDLHLVFAYGKAVCEHNLAVKRFAVSA